MDRLNQLLAGVDKLRALPASATRIIAMLNSGEPDLGEIAEIVRVDEAISMTVLRYANSATHGRPGREFNLKEGIGRLGTKMMMKIVLQHQVGNVLANGGVAFGLQRGALWRGALGGAFASEHLAETHAKEDRELCFMCGLLRDVGKLAMDAEYGADYGRMVAECVEPTMSFVEAERKAFGTDHAEVGAELALHWQLPERIADAIRHHHDPPMSEDERHDVLFDVVHAADILCLWAGMAIGNDGMQYRLAPHVRESLNMSRPQAEVIIALMWDKFNEVDEAMNASNGERRTA